MLKGHVCSKLPVQEVSTAVMVVPGLQVEEPTHSASLGFAGALCFAGCSQMISQHCLGKDAAVITPF